MHRSALQLDLFPIRLLTVDQARKQLQVGRTSLFKFIREGRLRVVKVGRLTRIHPEDLASFIAHGRGVHG